MSAFFAMTIFAGSFGCDARLASATHDIGNACWVNDFSAWLDPLLEVFPLRTEGSSIEETRTNCERGKNDERCCDQPTRFAWAV